MVVLYANEMFIQDTCSYLMFSYELNVGHLSTTHRILNKKIHGIYGLQERQNDIQGTAK